MTATDPLGRGEVSPPGRPVSAGASEEPRRRLARNQQKSVLAGATGHPPWRPLDRPPGLVFERHLEGAVRCRGGQDPWLPGRRFDPKRGLADGDRTGAGAAPKLPQRRTEPRGCPTRRMLAGSAGVATRRAPASFGASPQAAGRQKIFQNRSPRKCVGRSSHVKNVKYVEQY